MITLKKYGKTYNMAPLELSGLSTDNKPINNYQTYTIVNGSIFEEIDTGNTYKYDAENDTWKLQPKTSGGADGITPLLKKTDTAIQVSYNNGDSWKDLVLLADITGPAGAKGETGETGPQGPAGADGKDGVQGPAGEDGSAATIQIGEVTTGAAGSQASVTNVGTANAAILNFSIPQGVAGTPGIPGQDGEDGADGAPGAAGAAGADGASITGITLTLTKDGEGAITGGSGTATLSTGGPIEFTVNVSEAGA